MKIITIIGARPQFIKAAIVSMAILNKQANGINIREKIIHTGQHFDENMSDVFFKELEIPRPHYNLGIAGGGHGQMTGRMLEEIENILVEEKSDFVLVYGDTNSTLADALAAAKLNIPVVHVESGLRSFNKKMPEEINRIITDQVSSILFTPTANAVENLKRESFNNIINGQFSLEKKPVLPFPYVINVGDVMYDAANYYAFLADKKSNVLEDLQIEKNNYALATVHRAENTDDPTCLKNIIIGLNEISKTLKVVFPVHPRTKKAIQALNISKELFDKIVLIEPVSYLDMICLEKESKLVLTDSGGVQKEAFFYKKPCITLRTETEWIELVESG